MTIGRGEVKHKKGMPAGRKHEALPGTEHYKKMPSRMARSFERVEKFEGISRHKGKPSGCME